jgi:hypothetical protein
VLQIRLFCYKLLSDESGRHLLRISRFAAVKPENRLKSPPDEFCQDCLIQCSRISFFEGNIFVTATVTRWRQVQEQNGARYSNKMAESAVTRWGQVRQQDGGKCSNKMEAGTVARWRKVQ